MTAGGVDTTDRSSGDRSVPLLLAAAGLVIVVVAGVLVFGIERPPSLESVAAEPALVPPASLAWAVWDGGERCLSVADPNGTVAEVTCGDLDGELLGWTDEGIVFRSWGRGTNQLVTIDPVTGERSVRPEDGEPSAYPSKPAPAAPSVHSARSWTERDDGRLRVWLEQRGGDADTLLWEITAPSSYDVVSVVPSPDGSVVALSDTADRLLVVPTDGSEPPRIWSDDVDTYGTLVWEGTERAAMDS